MKNLYRSLYFQVLVAIGLGVLLGYFYPETGAKMKPLGDGFIKLIKMLIAPVIFCTVVMGIAGVEDMKKVGKTGGLALIYFEVMSTISLILGLVIVNILQPGRGMNADPPTSDTGTAQGLHRAGQTAVRHRLCAQRHSLAVRRRICEGRDTAGAVDRDPFWICHPAIGQRAPPSC